MARRPIIGMSPGNSYFKDPEVEYLLKTTIAEFGKVAILVADIPAIATYMAHGYPENRARNKAIPKGNNLKNRARRIADELGVSDKVRIIDWGREVEGDPRYQKAYLEIDELYRKNSQFTEAANRATKSVLENAGIEADFPSVAVHYLLAELAFLQISPKFLEASETVYVYHRDWPVYQEFIAGTFDGKPRNNLDFLIIEKP